MKAFEDNAIYLQFFEDWNSKFLYKGKPINLNNNDVGRAKETLATIEKIKCTRMILMVLTFLK